MRRYRVINTFENEYHDYDITIETTDEGEKFTLLRSSDSYWSENARGEVALSLLDTGDGIVFPKKTFSGEIDYALSSELFILLSFIHSREIHGLYRGRIEEYKIIDAIIL